MPVCLACRGQPPEGARFCPLCGAPLTDDVEVSRRGVTILFSDISGFTTLAAHLDPERLRGVMKRYYTEMRAVIDRHEGTVERFIGDAVMAVFGFPRLHEDDAVRAVRAAVEIRLAAAALNVELEKDWGVTIGVHSGVNTGEVATGEAGDSLVVGDAVNVAARLQQLASEGEVLVGPLTARLVRDTVELEDLGPLAVKGKDAPVMAHRVLSVRPIAAGPARRLTTPVVGRDAELARLRGMWDETVSHRSCRLVTVVGPPGIGKTRLVAEFVDALGDEATVLEGRCQPYGERTPLAPVGEMVRQAVGLTESAHLAAAHAELVRVLHGADDQLRIVEHVLSVLGLEWATTGPDEAAWAVRKLFEAVASRRPLVLVFEDLHWGEPTLLGLVRHLRDWSRGAPILLVCLCRPELVDEGGWGDEAPNSSTIALTPLSLDDSVQLVERLMGGDAVSRKALAHITDAARGNALYLEEVVSMLIGDGALRHESGRWVFARDASSITVPPTIQALLAARIDRLPAPRRRVLEVAAVAGTTFSADAVQALLPDVDRADLEETFRWLAEREIVDVAEGGAAHQFHHVLLREATYNGMTKEARARLHESLADWLDGSREGITDADADAVIGHHLEQAYRYLVELRPVDDHAAHLARRGGECLSAMGCRAFQAGEMPGAASTLSRAVSLLPVTDPLRMSLLPDLAEALMSTGELARTNEVLEEGLGRAPEIRDRQVGARLVLIRSTLRVFTDPQGGAEALQDVHATIPVLEQLGDERGLAQAWHLLGMVDLAQSRFAAAEHAMERAAWHAHNASDRRRELEILSWLPVPIWVGPRPAEEGIRRFEVIRERAGGDRRVEGIVAVTRATLEAMLGSFEDARRSIGTARALLEDLGLRVLLAGSSQNAGVVEQLAGDAATADRELATGLRALQEMGETGLLSTVAGLRAQVLYELGRDDEAEEMANVAEGAAGPTDLFSLVLAKSARAKVWARQGRIDDAERLARGAARVAQDTDSPQLMGDAVSDLARVLAVAGDRAQAAELSKEAIRHFERKGNVVAVRRTRELMDTLGAAVP